MPKYQFSNKAVEDLSNIWDCTFEKWSEKQADKYYSDIIMKCKERAKKLEGGNSYSGLL